MSRTLTDEVPRMDKNWIGRERPGWLDLRHYDTHLRGRARRALAGRDAEGFLVLAPNDYGIEIVWRNQGVLAELDILEDAFVRAVTSPRVNNRHGYLLIRGLLQRMDRQRLRDAGSPLPDAGPWTLYRGVAGHGKARRVRGYAWTRDPDRARWFADRFGLINPGVVTTTVRDRHVVFYSNDRGEEEFFVDLPARYAVRRML